MRHLAAASVVLLLCVPPAFAQTSRAPEPTPWSLGILYVGKTYPTTIAVKNASCAGRHTLTVQVEDAPWLHIRQKRMKDVRAGEARSVEAVVDLRGVAPGEYRGRVLVRCPTCTPGLCLQDLSTFIVTLTARAVAVSPRDVVAIAQEEPKCKDATSWIGRSLGLGVDCELLLRERPVDMKALIPRTASVQYLKECNNMRCDAYGAIPDEATRKREAESQLQQLLAKLRVLYPDCTITGKLTGAPTVTEDPSSKAIVKIQELGMQMVDVQLTDWGDATAIASLRSADVKFTWVQQRRLWLAAQAEISWDCKEMLICTRLQIPAGKGTCPVKVSALYCPEGEQKTADCVIRKLGMPVDEEVPREAVLHDQRARDLWRMLIAALPKMMDKVHDQLCECIK